VAGTRWECIACRRRCPGTTQRIARPVTDEVFQTPVGAIHRLRFGASFIKIVDASATGSEAVQTSTYNDAGLRYLTFETPDIQDTWQGAVDSGASVVIALQSAPGGGPRSGTFRDPEGNLVELLCRTPSA
jgi:predicted enzyme related to lactoylglutathione lyase